MTPTCSTCSTCAEIEVVPTVMHGRPFTAEICRRMGAVTVLARMAWTGRYGQPSGAEHCGVEGRWWRAA